MDNVLLNFMIIGYLIGTLWFYHGRIMATTLHMQSPNPGTVNIALLFPGHETPSRQLESSDSKSVSCGAVIPSQALLATQLRRIVQDINNGGILPFGIKLGYEIYDNCGSPSLAIDEVFQWVKNGLNALGSPNPPPPIAFVVGSSFSRVSKKVAPLLAEFGIPMIDYGATSPTLSNPKDFPMYARVVSSDRYMAKAMVDLVGRLGWKCVHVLYSQGEYGENGAEIVSQYLLNASICIAGGGPLSLPINETDDKAYDRALAKMGESQSIRPVICFCEDVTVRGMLTAFIRQQKLDLGQKRYFMMAGDFWGNDLNLENLQSIAEESITFHTRAIPGQALSSTTGRNSELNDWIAASARLTPNEADPWLEECLQKQKGCTIKTTPNRCRSTIFDEGDLPPSDWLALLSNAVYAGAFALRSFYNDRCQNRMNQSTECSTKFNIKRDGPQLYRYITNVTFLLENGANFSFYQKRDGYPRLAISKYTNVINGSVSTHLYKKIASWDDENGLNWLEELDSFHRPGSDSSCENSHPLCKATCRPGTIVVESSINIAPNDGIIHLPGSSDCCTVTASSNSNQVALAVVAALLSAAIAALIAGVIFLSCKTTAQQNAIQFSEEQKFLTRLFEDPSCLYTDEEKIDLKELFSQTTISNGDLITSKDVLGQGQNGIAYKGTLCYGTVLVPVAVKTLKSQNRSEIADFIREGSVMGRFDHPNVLKFLGFKVVSDSLRIVVPLMPDGNLRTYLMKEGANLAENDRTNLCLQICSAMEYLSSKQCIHRDLACRNILVQKLPYMILVKLADFGLTRQLNESDYYQPADKSRAIPVRWWPPEALKGDLMFDQRSDVWSFGVVMWEIFSDAKRPYDNMDNKQVWDYIINRSGKLDRPVKCGVPFFHEIMESCWERTPAKRPTFKELLDKLKSYQRSRWSVHSDVTMFLDFSQVSVL